MTPGGWLGRGLLLVLGLGLALAGAELAAAVLWRAPWHERLLDAQRQGEEATYLLNDFGLRDADLVPKPAGTRRVLLLGDSFTFGLGVTDDAAIFANRLERDLSVDEPVEILNGGLPGSHTHDWLALLDEVAPRYEPDVVVAVFFLRDGTRTPSIPGFFDRIRDEVARRNRESALYRASYLVRFVRDRIDRAEIGKEYTQAFRDAYFGEGEAVAEWLRARQNLVAIRDRAHERGARFGLAVFPVLVSLQGPHPFEAIHAEIARFAQQEAMPHHDLLPGFRGQPAPPLWVSPYDQHPSPRAHAIAADSLRPFLTALLRDP